MNYRTSTIHKSNNWRAQTEGSVAHKLLSVKLDHHRELQSLRREIKRLRAEVGLMARLRNFHQAQTQRLADILRKLPPPAIPTRHTQEVAEPPTPQNDTTAEGRGRPRTRGGSGSDKSTSCEDGKLRTKEKGKGRDEDTPMTEQCDHTIGETRNDKSSAHAMRDKAATIPLISIPTDAKRRLDSRRRQDGNGSRTHAESVVSVLRKGRSNTKSPAPKPKEDLAKAKQVRRKDKEWKRAAPKLTPAAKSKEEEVRKKAPPKEVLSEIERIFGPRW